MGRRGKGGVVVGKRKEETEGDGQRSKVKNGKEIELSKGESAKSHGEVKNR